METTNSSAETWSVAKKYARSIGHIPGSFTVAIRSLINDHVNNDRALRPVIKYQVARLLKTPSFRSMLYYATKDLRGGYVGDQEFLNTGTMMDMFEPLDLAVMIASYYCYRRGKKMLDSESWELISLVLDEESQISAQVGAAIPQVGIGASLLAGTLEHFSWCTILKAKPKEGMRYLKALRKGEKRDPARELQDFGCEVSQINSMLLSHLGFGIEMTQSYTLGIDPGQSIQNLEDHLAYHIKMATLWVEAIIKNLDQPSIKIPGQYYPMQADRIRMNDFISNIKDGKKHWLAMGKADVSKDKTPQLFVEAPQDEEFEVPDELREVFSLDQITAMEEEAFDDLIDQMDMENSDSAPKGTVILSSNELSELDDMVD